VDLGTNGVSTSGFDLIGEVQGNLQFSMEVKYSATDIITRLI
jgi:hypothetical protein